MRWAISRNCLRSCASSSWMPAKMIWNIQKIRPHGVSFDPGSLAIGQKLPGTRPSHSGLVSGSCIRGREKRADPARLVALQVDDHREPLLRSEERRVGKECRSRGAPEHG